MDESSSQLIWVDDDTEGAKLSIPHDLATEVTERVDDMGSSMTQSLVLGAAVQNYAEGDELARIESYLDEQLESRGVPPSSLKSSKNKISQSDWREAEKYGFRAKLPGKLVSLIEDNAPSARRKGWWATNALIEYLDSPYESRLARIETKRQVITVLDGSEVDKEEQTGVMADILAGNRFSGVYDAISGGGVREYESYEDVPGDPWGDEKIIIHQPPHGEELDMPRTPRVRVPVTLAYLRSFNKDVKYIQVANIVRRQTVADYGSQSAVDNIIEQVWEQAQEEDCIPIEDNREALEDEFTREIRKTSKSIESVLGTRNLSSATIPELHDALDKLST